MKVFKKTIRIKIKKEKRKITYGHVHKLFANTRAWEIVSGLVVLNAKEWRIGELRELIDVAMWPFVGRHPMLKKKCSGFKCIQTTNSCFFHAQRDYARFCKISIIRLQNTLNTDVPENFKSLGQIVQPLGHCTHTQTLTQTLTQTTLYEKRRYDDRLDISVCYSLVCE